MNWFKKLFARKTEPSFSPHPPEPVTKWPLPVVPASVEPRIDPNTLTAAEWMKVLETVEKRISKLRNENIDLRQTIKIQQDEMNVMRRAFELIGVDAFKVHELYHDVSRRHR